MAQIFHFIQISMQKNIFATNALGKPYFIFCYYLWNIKRTEIPILLYQVKISSVGRAFDFHPAVPGSNLRDSNILFKIEEDNSLLYLVAEFG